MTTLVRCARALVEGEELREFGFAIDGDEIHACGPAAKIAAMHPGADVRSYGDDVVVAPGFINGHSHAYQILMRGWADDLPFERWRADALYKIVPQLTPPQIYWVFRLAFDEMLAAGITTVAEFFYLNGAGNEHAREAIRAAHDAGIRLVFARTWMDAPYAPAAFRETIDVAEKRTTQLMDEFPNVDICVAPHSLHAASPQMVRACAEYAADRACTMHIHVAEAQYEGAQTLERFGKSPVEYLASLEALNPRTVAIHAIYINGKEKRMLAESGASVIHNPMTNQYLGDGICDVKGLQALSVPVGLGTDADVKPSLFDEMRAASLLQKLANLDGSALSAPTAFAMGTFQGAQALHIAAGDLQPRTFADYLVIDAAKIDAWSRPVNALVYRAEDSWVRETYVGGRRVRTRESKPPAQADKALRDLLPALSL